jgi:DNA repair photolyase
MEEKVFDHIRSILWVVKYQVPLICRFDPWHSGLCTCPPKLSFNPYTGCDHGCLYCYATSYIQNHQTLRTKKNLLPTLRRELSKLDGEILAMSSSSDPYPTEEANRGITRQCLKVISQSNCRLQVFTKSDIVARDADLLAEIPSTVAITITTDDDALAAVIEPKAPPPSQRLKAIQTLTAQGIPVIARIDPIIPTLNDNPTQLIQTLAALGVKHITSSTYKVKPDNWTRLTEALPETAEKLHPLYYQQGEMQAGNRLLPKELRFKILKQIRNLADAHGMRFGVCREGLAELNNAPCDGSWLLPKPKEATQCRLA